MIHVFCSSGFFGSNFCKWLNKKKINHLQFTSKKKLKKKNSFYLYNKKPFKFIKDKDVVIFFIAATSVKNIKDKSNFYLNFNKKIKDILKMINTKAYLIYISTDYVYSGKNSFYNDNANPQPINLYGKLKLDIEFNIKKNFSNYLILRSPKIFSNNIKLNTLYSETYKKLKNKEKLNVLVDQKIQLLNLDDFIKIILKIINKKIKIVGNFNLVGKTITRYDFTKLIARKFNFKKNLINPISYKSLKEKYFPKKLILKTNLYKKINFNHKFKM
jgi:dTDP-4-dehydrorhamnose reductase